MEIKPRAGGDAKLSNKDARGGEGCYFFEGRRTRTGADPFSGGRGAGRCGQDEWPGEQEGRRQAADLSAW
eukprot:10177868-Alexandrium_andersonii.AAC.1